MSSEYPLTVYFDASCPMCHSELLNIKAHDADGHLQLVDCSAPGFDDTPFQNQGISRDDMMARLHVQDRLGAWTTGAAAMELIYRAAGLQRMARLWQSHALLGRMYSWIARNRQALSLTGVPLLFGAWRKWQVWRLTRRTRACKDGNCTLEKGDRSMTRTLQNWLLALAWLHLAIGIALPFIAWSALFAPYSALLHHAFWPGMQVPAETLVFQRWIVSLFGPTLASVGVVMIWLVRAGIRNGESWPWTAILVALAVWAPGDIGLSLMKDFWLHVWIDLAALLTIVPPALWLRQHARLSAQHPLNPC